MAYYPRAKAQYGPNAKDPKLRNTMMQGICAKGECFHVPSGYWHCKLSSCWVLSCSDDKSSGHQPGGLDCGDAELRFPQRIGECLVIHEAS